MISASERRKITRQNKRSTSIYSVDSGASEFDVQDFETSSEEKIDENIDFELLKVREDEPNLFNMPSALSPIYRSMSTLTKFLIGSFALIMSISSNVSLRNKTSKGSFKMLFMKNIFMITLNFVFIGTFTKEVVKELFHAPSRIDTLTLMNRKWLPSPLSKISMVSSELDDTFLPKDQEGPISIDKIGVHYLQYDANDKSSIFAHENKSSYEYDALHFNHGFGASSLSWLPAIPSLVKKLNAKSAIAHDSPGFGFTERPQTLGRRNSLVPFSSAGNAALGNALLLDEIGYKNSTDETEESKMKRVGLFGHSMGCATTLRMALTLPRDVQKFVVLVAPALIGPAPTSSEKSEKQKSGKNHESLLRVNLHWLLWSILTLIAALRKVIVDVPSMFILKRLVAQRNFWKKGLKLAWGNPDLVSDSDALRFQWPSIGQGWEHGLLAFTRSRIFSICPYKGGEQQLLKDVLELPNTSVAIIHGTNDPLIPIKMSRKIIERFPSNSISYIELDGLGHDPFEEEVDDFTNLF